jgi:L-iditol 2-dehydrogenase
MKGKVGFIPGAHKIEFREYDVPEPPPGGLIAEVTQTNVCGSEVHMWRGEFGGRRGIMPGHEMSGVVHALGKGTKTDFAAQPIKEGDRIAPVYYTVCNLQSMRELRRGTAFGLHRQDRRRPPSR